MKIQMNPNFKTKCDYINYFTLRTLLTHVTYAFDFRYNDMS
jgi:hypothetical protein